MSVISTATREPFLTILQTNVFPRLQGQIYKTSLVCKSWDFKLGEYLEGKTVIWQGKSLSLGNTSKLPIKGLVEGKK